ncbi:MAG: DUF4214 domain-containing protein [Pirellulales bacterium]
MAYIGKTYRGVDYHGFWPGWHAEQFKQTEDSDFANDAFQSLWGKQFMAATEPSFSSPHDNGTNYRDDLGTLAREGFTLVRLYDWNPARGTAPGDPLKGLDHINFLNYAKSLGMKVVVPVSNYFISNNGDSWNNVTPNSSYSFDSAPEKIQDSFKRFIASITDPTTNKIHDAVMISVANEPDYLAGPVADPPVTDASQALSRMNWWIYNLHKQINGTDGTNGPDGNPVVNGSSGPIVQIGATFGNGDQTGTNGSWFKALVSGAQQGQGLPSVWNNATKFSATVTGLSQVDSGFESYYFNSFNIGQSNTTPPYSNGIAATLALLDSGASPWPGQSFNVPVLLMEVFTPNRNLYKNDAEMAKAAVKEAQDIEAYLKSHNAGTPSSTTNLMGYNYFEFTDEAGARNKLTGLNLFSNDSTNAHTGGTSLFSGGYGDYTFPVYKLTPSVGPDGTGTLAAAWTAQFPTFLDSHNDAFVVLQGNPLGGAAPVGSLAAAVPFGVLTNDVSEETAFVAVQSGAKNGDLALAPDGVVAYTANDGFTGVDTFSYYAFGQYGVLDTSGVVIHVVPVDVDGTTATLQLLSLTSGELIAATYAAYLGRAADAGGYEYYVGEFNKSLPTQGAAAALAPIAHSFGTSAEAKALYPFLANPGGASDAQIADFLNSVYENLFDRPTDAPGSAYWVGQIKQALQSGNSVDAVVVNIMSGAQETAAAQDITTLMSRVAVSQEYVYQQELHGTDWAGASDIAAATTLLHSVTADPHSLVIGVRTAQELIAKHP